MRDKESAWASVQNMCSVECDGKVGGVDNALVIFGVSDSCQEA